MRTTPPPAPRSRRRSARLGLIVGVLAGSLVFGGGAAWAYWSAAATATGTVSTTKVSVALTGVDSLLKPLTNTFSSLSQSGASFTVTNTGAVPGDVSVTLATASAESAFASKINLTVWPKTTTCTSTVGAGSTTGTWANLPSITLTGLPAGGSREFCVPSSVSAGANIAGVQALATTSGSQTAAPSLKATLTPPGTTAWAPASDSGTASLKTQDIFTLDPAFTTSGSSGYGKNYGISLAAGGSTGTRCLDVSGSGTGSGSPVITYGCIAPPQANQIWRAAAGNVTPLSTTFSPTHTILTRNLSATAASNPATPNSLSITSQTTAASCWYVQKSASGQSQIVSTVDGRCLALDASGGQKTTLVDCASDAGLEVSSDGTHFARNSDAALFTDIGRVVPGSRGQDSVWFRNGTDREIRLRLQLSDGWTESAPLAEATTLTVKGLGTTRSTRLGVPLATGTCAVVSRDYLLPPSKTVRLDAQVAVSTELTDREGALKSLGFSLKVFAADASVDLPATCGVSTQPTPEPSAPPPSGDPALPPPSGEPPVTPPAVKPPLAQTGFGAGLLAATGAALAGLGLLLARRRRGKRNA